MERSISIQAVLYEPDQVDLNTFIECLINLRRPVGYTVEVRIGDCGRSPIPQATVDDWKSRFALASTSCTYTFFGANIGFGAGHNRLSQQASSDFILVINPDTVFTGELLDTLVTFADARPNCGIAEARQYPLEHPKSWNASDFTTDWCSCCCALVSGSAFREVGGFDESFFLYSEDVDLSWRIRALGKQVCYCPSAGVYHRKRLTVEGIEVGDAERTWGLVGLLLLNKKYGNERALSRLTRLLHSGRESRFATCLAKFNEASALLSPVTPSQRSVASFGPDGSPGNNRWSY